MKDSFCGACRFHWRHYPLATMPVKRLIHLLHIFISLSMIVKGTHGQFTCNQPGHDEVIKWREQPRSLTLQWRLDQVCSGTLQCYGFEPETGEVAQDVQLCPAQMQYRDPLYILPPPPASPYTTTVVNVTEAEFYSCPSRIYPSDQVLQNSNSSGWLQIPERFLKPGVLYLTQHPDGAFSNCNFGLRIKILIKDMNCRASSSANICSERGSCGSKLFEESYRCYCYENYRGTYCDEYDACSMDPCRNGAKCVDGDEGLIGSNFLCVCTEGFTGADCSEIIGQCSSGVCHNGSCIAVSPIAFKCQCRQGFSGSYCQNFTNMCSPNPCQNQATCISQLQGYTCQCPPGFTGIHCETNVDECASNPCASGATCVDDVNGFYCRCPPGFDSGLCSEPINFCESKPCENGGLCLPLLNGYYCNCTLGFHGFRCEDVISQCSQVPGICKNGGHCLPSTGGPIQCQCSPGWTGPTCDRLDNLCRFNPCPNATLCIDTSTVLRPGTYECACPPGYTGDTCQIEIQECSSSPCQNGGVCVDQLAKYVCRCPEGYTGLNCETNIDMCTDRAHLLCLNNGTCVDGNIGFTYSCICLPGFTSADCSVDIQECESSPCVNDGTCIDGINSYTCICPHPYYGPNCARYFDYCSLNPCGNGATCIPAVGTYQCVCPPGFYGVNCTQDVDECSSNPCRNAAPCIDLPNAFRCECPLGYTGRQCEVNINDCRPGLCLNGATCIDQLNGYRCACVQGYAGEDCGREISECLSAPCQHGGICSDEINGYKCFCDTQIWAGLNCEIPLNNCSYSPCLNGATCEPISNTKFRCNCPDRYTGPLCGAYMELCLSRPCLNGGTCSENLEDNQYDCFCPFGYFGKHCESNTDFCLGHECRNGATCVDGTQDYTCTCPAGYRGRYCEIDIDDCISTPCKNGALCQDKVNGYQCFCVNGYVGRQCTEDLNECISSPCLNGAVCLNGRDRFVCECPVGYTGVRCEINIDDCEDHQCKNDARCIDDIGGYTCRCRPGFVGADCSFEINECLSSPCSAQGTFVCSDGVAEYTCVCKRGYRGRHCEIDIDECSSDPCLNDATCVNLVDSFRCICPSGITGRICENNIDECASNPCGVGTCVESVNGYTCNCPSDGTIYDRNCFPVQPCLSRPCFNKAECINLPNNRYRCDCPRGYEGVNCESLNFCTFNNITCQNGGLCLKERDNFTCVCTAGFSGKFCEINIDECERNFCRNRATCVDGVNSYTCECVPGFVGTFCETLATSCSEGPCQNGATCYQTSNIAERTLFTCLCPSGFEGAYCQIETDECASDPCKNGGTCTQSFSFYTCECKPGYRGTDCEVDIDECVNHGCRNGASCIDGINGYRCQCPVGITGVFCETQIDDCDSSPCQNGGRCVDLQEGYQCFCKNGFTGLTCAVDYDECVSDPCLNSATCVDLVAAFECACPPGITGTLCETNLDECSSSPCQNGADCIDGLNGFTCTCVPGSTGTLCETDIDECASSPCTNGGTCRDRQNMYVCDCPQPYRGMNCALLPCDLNPCESGGTCFNDLSRLPDGFRCECIEGLTGTRCQSNIDDCRRDDGTVPCMGRGLCLDKLNYYTCYCQPGWKGDDCEVPIDECAGNNCKNNATCVNLWRGYRCDCALGYQGQLCERETDECQSNPCTNGATCVDLPNDFNCICKDGWTGKQCASEINECTQTTNNPCRNGGTCVDAFANFTCQCPPFFTGRLCEMSFDPCGPTYNQCLHGATCITIADGTYRCRCAIGYTGANCEIDVDECSSSPCLHGAQCEDQVAGYVCYCPQGFTGSNCETDIDDCLYCQNGATCEDLVNGYICTCAEGYRGTNCTEDVDECAENSPCLNGGTCSNAAGGYRCICKIGYTGHDCETDVDECLSRPCQNKATCEEGFGDFTCVCPPGYSGVLCEIDINDCIPHPCGNGNCTDIVNGFTCTCFPGWGGGRCDLELNECLSQPCLNGATCKDDINRYTCECADGFTGPRCEIDVDVCQNQQFSQCRNGGTCVDLVGSSFFCSCKPAYTGRFCEVEVNECLSQPCQNGATCEDQLNQYRCICPPGWYGVQCSIDIDECESSPCKNSGICQQREAGAGYECLCQSGLGGTHCEINYDDCIPIPACLNGGTCLDGLNNFTCICPPYSTGDVCETLLYTPTTTLAPSTISSATASSTTINPTASTTSLMPTSSLATRPSTGLVSDTYLSSPVIDSSLLSGTASVTMPVEDSSVPFVSIRSTMLSTFSSFEPYSSVTHTLVMEPEVHTSTVIPTLGSAEAIFDSLPSGIMYTSVQVGDGSDTLVLSSPAIDQIVPTSLHGTDGVSSMLNVGTTESDVLVAPSIVYPSIQQGDQISSRSLEDKSILETELWTFTPSIDNEVLETSPPLTSEMKRSSKVDTESTQQGLLTDVTPSILISDDSISSYTEPPFITSSMRTITIDSDSVVTSVSESEMVKISSGYRQLSPTQNIISQSSEFYSKDSTLVYSPTTVKETLTSWDFSTIYPEFVLDSTFDGFSELLTTPELIDQSGEYVTGGPTGMLSASFYTDTMTPVSPSAPDSVTPALSVTPTKSVFTPDESGTSESPEITSQLLLPQPTISVPESPTLSLWEDEITPSPHTSQMGFDTFTSLLLNESTDLVHSRLTALSTLHSMSQPSVSIFSTTQAMTTVPSSVLPIAPSLSQPSVSVLSQLESISDSSDEDSSMYMLDSSAIMPTSIEQFRSSASGLNEVESSSFSTFISEGLVNTVAAETSFEPTDLLPSVATASKFEIEPTDALYPSDSGFLSSSQYPARTDAPDSELEEISSLTSDPFPTLSSDFISDTESSVQRSMASVDILSSKSSQIQTSVIKPSDTLLDSSLQSSIFDSESSPVFGSKSDSSEIEPTDEPPVESTHFTSTNLELTTLTSNVSPDTFLSSLSVHSLLSPSLEFTMSFESTSHFVQPSVSVSFSQLPEESLSVKDISSTFEFESLSPSMSILETDLPSSLHIKDVMSTLLSTEQSTLSDFALDSSINIQPSSVPSSQILSSDGDGLVSEITYDTIRGSFETMVTRASSPIFSDLMSSEIAKSETVDVLATSTLDIPDATVQPNDTREPSSSIETETIKPSQTITTTLYESLEPSDISQTVTDVTLSASLDGNLQSSFEMGSLFAVTETPGFEISPSLSDGFQRDTSADMALETATLELTSILPEGITVSLSIDTGMSSGEFLGSSNILPTSPTVPETVPITSPSESSLEGTVDIEDSFSSLEMESRSGDMSDSLSTDQLLITSTFLISESSEDIIPNPTEVTIDGLTSSPTIKDSNNITQPRTESIYPTSTQDIYTSTFDVSDDVWSSGRSEMTSGIQPSVSDLSSLESNLPRASQSMETTSVSPSESSASDISEILFPSTVEIVSDFLSSTQTPTSLLASDSAFITSDIRKTVMLTDASSYVVSESDMSRFDSLVTSQPVDQLVTDSLTDSGVLVTDNVISTGAVADQSSLISVSTSSMPVTVSMVTVVETTVTTSTMISSSSTTEVSPSIEPTQTTTTDSMSTQTTASPSSTPEPKNCFDGPCLNGGTCETTVEGNQLSYVCHCTMYFTGQRCQTPLAFIPVEFVGSSLLTFNPIPLQTTNIFQLTFQTIQADGVIFYSAKDYTKSEATHYIRLLVKDGILRYQFSCMVQNFDLDSNVKVDTGQIFNVIIRQTSNCRAKLEVSGPVPSTSVELGMAFIFPTLYLNTLSLLYVGGIPSNISSVPARAPSFVGCIRSFFINNQRYSIEEAIGRLDVGTCGNTLPTLPPVDHSTSTTTKSTTTTAATTTSSTTTPVTRPTTTPPPTCDDIICLNGGSCRNVETPSGHTRYQCDCPLHYTGSHCEQEIGISFPEFLGISYLQHPDLDFSSQRSNDLYLSFKTSSKDGSLLYSHGVGNDFIHLFIADGYLRYQASCGPTNVLFVDTRARVDKDTLVSVSIRQIQEEDGDCTVTVTINNDLETAVTLTLTPSQGSLTYDLGPLYLGGLPPAILPLGRTSPFINYVGCIRHLQINGEERLVYQDAIAGQNIRECDVPPCEYQPCYNNATCIQSVDGYTCECLPTYSGVLCERTACDRNPCFHGGTCIHTPQTQDYTCLCPYGRHGANCQQELAISRPQYYGMQLGYLSFIAYPKMQELATTFDFRFSFTLEENSSGVNDLLIFAGQSAAQSNYGADYFAVGIVEDYVHFQFNLGSGKADIRTTSPIDRSRQFHRVRFGRHQQQGYLGLDERPPLYGTSQGMLMGLNADSKIYVGGYDNYDIELPAEIPFRGGFRGCLYDLEVRTGTNGQWKKPGSPPGQPEIGRNVGQCQQSECQLSNCLNGGTCVDLGATFRCECVSGWKGVRCADRITPCDNQHDCSHGSTCIPLDTGGYACLCPLGKAGDLCDKEIRITDARFVGESSYMGFQHKGSLRFAVDIHLQFKPDVRTGLLLYMAEHLSRRSGDFLSVSLRGAYVQLRYQVGVEGTVVVTSLNKVSINSGTWHSLAVGRNTSHGYVILDDKLTFVKVTNQMVGLDVTTPIFVGGVPELEAISSSAVENEPSAFEGCVRELIINKRRYELSEKGATSGVNVVDCDGDECGYGVCKNGGTCFNSPSTRFFCACTSEYTGLHCELSKLCENNDCASGSTCVPVTSNATYRCICPLGKEGSRCQQDLNFTNPRFTGDSYILFHDVSHNVSDFTVSYVSLNFTTTVPNGLIVWNGQAYSDQDDYLGVGVQNGRVRVVISLGWWTREDLITEERVSDGQWHSLIIHRNGRQLMVYVDGNRYNVNLAGQFSGLNTDGAYYFGGFEPGKSLLDETCGHFPAHFIGCLKDTFIHADSKISISFSQATAGANIQSCDNR